jgi:hypothetical protein
VPNLSITIRNFFIDVRRDWDDGEGHTGVHIGSAVTDAEVEEMARTLLHEMGREPAHVAEQIRTLLTQQLDESR